MRYDKLVAFINVGETRYDTELSKTVHDESDPIYIYTNVSQLAPERSRELFNDLTERRLVIRLLNKLNFDWNKVIVDDIEYVYETDMMYDRKQSIIVREVRND